MKNANMKKRKILAVSLIVFVISYLLLHISPSMAIRARLITLGQIRSISLLFSDIEEDDFHNKLDKKVAKKSNGKFYVITNEKSDSILRKPYSWLVTKKHFLYFAQPYGKS